MPPRDTCLVTLEVVTASASDAMASGNVLTVLTSLDVRQPVIGAARPRLLLTYQCSVLSLSNGRDVIS